MRFLNILLLTAVVLSSGCQTYLGRVKRYDHGKAVINEVVIDSKDENEYWQYTIENGRLSLVNSVVRAISYDRMEEIPYCYEMVYLKYPLKRVSLLAYHFRGLNMKNSLAKFLTCSILACLPPGCFYLIGDFCRWGYRWIQYPFAVYNNWNLKDDGPGLMYRIAYLPFIANCNPFMLPPYLVKPEEVGKYAVIEWSKYETEKKKFRYKTDREFGIPKNENRVLFINGQKVSLANMPGGYKTIDLRKKEYIPYMLPAKDVKIQVKVKNKTVVDLKIKTTDIIQGEYLYLWNIVNNQNANYGTRLSALNKLHSLKVIDNASYLKLKRNILDE